MSDPDRTDVPQPLVFLNDLRAAWPDSPAAPELDAIVRGTTADGTLESLWALKVIRATALALARRAGAEPMLLPLLRRALDFYVGRPIRDWDEVMWALDVAVAGPEEARRLIRTVVVSIRLGVKGDVPWLANLGGWGDATHQLLPLITDKLERLFEGRRELGPVLYRQLVKSLPHLGASATELEDVRSAPEGLQWLLDCPLTLDIREQIHSRASPANLTLARAYLQYLETGDRSGLAKLWMAQKIPEHDRLLQADPDPAGLKAKLLEYTREMEAILTRIYAFDPESPSSVLADVALWLKAAGKQAPARAAELLDQCRRKDSRATAITLAAVRGELAGAIDSSASAAGLRLLYLDLELEKLGYLLYGEVVNDQLGEVSEASMPEVVTVLRAMMASENMKGWESPRLAWLCRAFDGLSGDPGDRTAQLMVLNHQINDEIARVGLIQYQEYSEIVRSMLHECGTANVEMEVNRFVDGLIRGTTLHHIGELALRIHHFVLGKLEGAGETLSHRIRARVERYHRQYESEAFRAAAAAGPDAVATPMWIYRFQPGQTSEPDASPDVLGAKGANLCVMSALGLPVPPGFVVSVRACERYMTIHALDPTVHAEIRAAMRWLEGVTGRAFGDPRHPLLVSVRSGAPLSMPGMLDTILNVGMTDEIARRLGEALADETAALDSYIHFLLGYAKSAFSLDGLPGHLRGVPTWETVAAIKRRVLDAGLDPFWEEVDEQVNTAVEAVFRSWNNPHAVLFRKMHAMPQLGCTAATVQQMVLGNADARSCTGVALTGAPATGAPGLRGEYLPQAHGEDLVSGLLTPLPIQRSGDRPGRSLAETMPEIVEELSRIGSVLEKRFGEMQEIEFTVELGRLHILQTRPARRAGQASPASLSRASAPPGSPPPDAAGAGHAQEPAAHRYRIVARGLGASPGGVLGRIALSPEAVRRFSEAGDQTVFVRPTTTPADLAGMVAAAGVLTQRGGVTSHAANNARYMDKPCVVGCLSLQIDAEKGTVALGGSVLREGDLLFIDGTTGEVGLPVSPPDGAASSR